MTVPTSPRRLICARCSAVFKCGLSADCWCAAEPYRLPIGDMGSDDCLCPTCLRRASEALAEASGPRL